MVCVVRLGPTHPPRSGGWVDRHTDIKENLFLKKYGWESGGQMVGRGISFDP